MSEYCAICERGKDAKRCEAVDPYTGIHCGDYAGHGGTHTALAPSYAPWGPHLCPNRVKVEQP